jgi:TatD DNase family protein
MSPADVDHAALAAAGPWIDTHCHLSLEDEKPADPATGGDGTDPSGAGVTPRLDDARRAGVARFVTIATDLPSAHSSVAVAGAHPDVWATVGLHPHDAVQGIDGLDALLTADRVVAVGECGLDYHYEHSPRDVQRDAFAAQIELAKRHDLALVVHTREAWDDTFAIFDAEGMPERTIIHCFTGGPDEARRCLDRGAHLSFSGIVTFRNAQEVRDAAQVCPDDRLLVETDSPFLAPVPFRGKPNRPGWVPVVGAAVAAARGVTPAVLASAVWDNAATVFQLP